ncbi:hypothetical protein ROA7450_01415 [Roseovarius albus]|uniref:DUF3833 domain-containing protein n=1 Tax=Roseovarius albus TaxID=1247867 RepID=A0A1X6YV72_9RHOB|nr:DUF3833 domain-containing protein [Roseovarius albus]SLN31653.1 hypothetical protein ROA7450_01415 [Roseovarius albus]
MLRALVVLALIMLTACNDRPTLEQQKLSQDTLNLEEFFEGGVIAHGQFKDVLGNVSRRFVVEIDGVWDGSILRLVEDFTYSDQTTEQRIWTLTKTGPDTWDGTAPGVLGTAKGTESGDTFNFKYTIDLPVDGKTTRVSFDDWMWKLSDNRVLNIAYMEKFGVKVGEVVIFFEKQ